MSHYKLPTARDRGFTLIEMLVIAPLIILVVGVFITFLINITGSVLISRGQNVLAYTIQDGLSRIEQDVKSSGAFLSTNNITLSSPQGYSNDTTAFHNVSTTQGTELILNMYTTNTNPTGVSGTQGIYIPNTPNTCASTIVNQNTPLYYNIVYFVSNGSLWRRTILPASYATLGCSVPWQQPSCTPGYSASFCQTNDIDVVDGIATGGFSVSYYPSSSSVTANATASDNTQTDTTRQSALSTTNTVGITITATQSIAGATVTQSGTLRVTSINNDTSHN